ncbi:hypothetical protein DL98DRAFT_470789 [Cadophora sp. DSE1049]|nr:hypothetical protein DL98DRAFT_470789 [Cadophora sp. DSE1049]
MKPSLGPHLLGVSILFLVTSWIMAGLRCFVRLRIVKAFGVDDWFLLVAVIFFTLMCAFNITSVSYGIGEPTQPSDIHRGIQGLKYQTLSHLFGPLVGIAIKLSIGLLLLRIAQQRRYRYTIYGCIVLLVMTNLTMFGLLFFLCRPIDYCWNRFFYPGGGTCLPTSIIATFGLIYSAVGMLVDWVFALIPIPMLWGINLKTRVKISVIVILSLGIFASIATVVRLKYLSVKSVVQIDKNINTLYELTHSFIWNVVEVGVGIAAACLATLRPFLKHLNILGFSSNNYDARRYPTSKSGTRDGYHVRASPGHKLRSIRRGRDSIRVESEQIDMERGGASWAVNNDSQDEILPHGGAIATKADVEISYDNAKS